MCRRTDAIYAFQQAIKIKPDHVPSWYNLGLTFYLDGQYAKAREVRRTLEKLDYEMAAKLRAMQQFLYCITPDIQRGDAR